LQLLIVTYTTTKQPVTLIFEVRQGNKSENSDTKHQNW